MTGNKYFYNNAGILTELAANQTSAGAGDAGKIVALNANGVLDTTVVNSKTTSAGAGDSGKIVALDAAGRIDTTMMPTGVAADTASRVTSEVIAAGDFVNIWDSSGAKVRKADATVAGKEAHGFCPAGAGAGASVTVYFEGTNANVTGQTPGPVFLSTTAGIATSTAPSASGNVVQRIGIATSATEVNFQLQLPFVLA